MPNSLISEKERLPVEIDALHDFILVGKEKLNAHKAKIRAIEKIDSAHIAKDAALYDAQDLADVLLDAETKLGEMLADIPNKKASSGKGTRSLPESITKKESHYSQTIAKNPDVVEKIKVKARNEGFIPTAKDVLKAVQKTKQKEKKAKKANIPKDASYQLIHADFNTATLDPVDIIITDPPYGKEYLHLYEQLAIKATEFLKPNGSLLVMTGQSYLPEILYSMGKHIKYHWMLAYLTPGGQSAQLWQRKINTFWKPVLWFVHGEYKGDWTGDVVKSNPNDNDKRLHKWGQSESGMADIIERLTYPGDTILDPFMGSGTTGIVAVQKGRNFIGVDNDEAAIKIAQERFGNGG